MGLTTSLYTGLSGLTANSQLISVAGNNIANVNTTGYKADRLNFSTQISEFVSSGSAPSGTSGGTNPLQVGLGVRLASTTRNFSTASLQNTGFPEHMAINGGGFFIINQNGSDLYTRAGAFTRDSNYNLVNPSGGIVQGYGIDENFNIIPGALTDIRIPLGALTIAEATSSVGVTGNMNSSGGAATTGTSVASAPIYSDALATTAATGTTLLTSVYNAGGIPLFATGDIITISGVERGGVGILERSFEVGPAITTGADANGTTVADFLSFFEGALGIDTSVGGPEGVSINGTGQIEIVGNLGRLNDLTIADADIHSDGLSFSPFAFTKLAEADGQSVRTTLEVFDSLDTPHLINLAIAMENKDDDGTIWRYYASSDDNTGGNTALGTGLLSFDNDGRLFAVSDDNVALNLSNSGAATPQSIAFSFFDGSVSLSALDGSDTMTAFALDGTAAGTLNSFSIGSDGTITGSFGNGQDHTLGQIAMAFFTNPQGLVDKGGSLLAAGANSGTAQILLPQTGGAGSLESGFLELSNVELTNEFINLISATTGFTASSRVLTTSQRLIDELLATIR